MLSHVISCYLIQNQICSQPEKSIETIGESRKAAVRPPRDAIPRKEHPKNIAHMFPTEGKLTIFQTNQPMFVDHFPRDSPWEAQAMQADGHTPTSGSAEKKPVVAGGCWEILLSLTELTIIRRDIGK